MMAERINEPKESVVFNKDEILRVMEEMRRPNGAFIASPTADYSAMWIRDTLYTTYAYWYLGEFEKCKQGVRVVLDYFKKYTRELKLRIASPEYITDGVIPAKCNADTFEKITAVDGPRWGHHQLDALGLFLYIVAVLDFKNLRVIRDESDIRILEYVVWYLRSVEYWVKPDFGMWEFCPIRHSSSIGAVVAGLTWTRNRRIVDIPDTLIRAGEVALSEILPYESRDRCGSPHHNHDCDAAQLSLFWPYNIVTNPQKAEELFTRIVDGHPTEQGEMHKLTRPRGLNRHWGDDYYRSEKGAYRGISGEWPMFTFWVSIIFSQQKAYDRAATWFREGCKTITSNRIPELYKDGEPNDHTPLAWAHAIALIAWTKLPIEHRPPQKSQESA